MKKPIQTTLACLVVMLHLGALVYFHQNKSDQMGIKKRLIVKTKHLTPPPKKIIPPKNPQITKPIAKKRKAKKPKPKQVKQTPTPRHPPKQEPRVPQKLWDKVEESIAKIEKSGHKEKTKKRLVVPEFVAERTSGKEYQLKLIACLHRSLSLPEHGDVTMELVLNSDGSVASLQVISAESTNNRTYLEKHVPTVGFPPMDKALLKTDQKRFVLTFCNEI